MKMKKIVLLIMLLSVTSFQPCWGQTQLSAQQTNYSSAAMHGEWFKVYKYLTTEKTIYLASTLLASYALGYANKKILEGKTDWKIAKYGSYGVMALTLFIDADIYRLDNAAIWKGISDGLLTSAIAYSFYNLGNEGSFNKPLLKIGLLVIAWLQNYIIFSLTN